MTWRTKLADWISGGELTRARVSEADMGAHMAKGYYGLNKEVKELRSTNERLASDLSILAIDNTNGWKNSERFKDALRSIADNTCCDGCQEAARVAKEALK